MKLQKNINIRGKMDMNDMDKIIHDADEANNCLPADRLRSFIERIEHLEEEKKGIQDDIKDVYAELRGEGFDVKTIKAIVKLRRMDAMDRDTQEALLELYKNALGM